MVKTIQLEGTELNLSNNLAWATIYKDQFGHDIVPDIMPILTAVLRLISEAESTKDLLKHIDYDSIQNALMEFYAVQFVDFINLVWALAKAYDEDTEPPAKWVRQFETFPLDIIVPAVLELMAKGLISSKNLQSLQKIIPTEA